MDGESQGCAEAVFVQPGGTGHLGVLRAPLARTRGGSEAVRPLDTDEALDRRPLPAGAQVETVASLTSSFLSPALTPPTLSFQSLHACPELHSFQPPTQRVLLHSLVQGICRGESS